VCGCHPWAFRSGQPDLQHRRYRILGRHRGRRFQGSRTRDGRRFWGVVYGAKAFLPHLIDSGDGHVVNMSSMYGLFAVRGEAAYNSAKFAVRGFTEALRQEMAVAGHPVKATCVHPGYIKTPLVRKLHRRSRFGHQRPRRNLYKGGNHKPPAGGEDYPERRRQEQGTSPARRRRQVVRLRREVDRFGLHAVVRSDEQTPVSAHPIALVRPH
jgi:NAD(P)-dependent dehydrogenase (short-subunit alcohol dehydrogenase family)